MNSHHHICNLCPGPHTCSLDTCRTEPQMDGPNGLIQMGGPKPCPAHEAEIAGVDDLPRPTLIRELGGATLIRVVARATRAALDVAAVNPEHAPGKFAAHVDALSPVDPTRTDADTWWRLGAVAGAKAAWAADLPPGPVYRIPPDSPRGEAGACYAAAWNVAGSIVLQVRMEVMSHGK
jgi:hypothetical protein